MAYTYPGNIRELANIIERAFIFCKKGRIEKKHLPESLFAPPPQKIRTDVSSLRDAEAAWLIDALQKNNWNCPETARQLGIHKSTLYRKIKALGITLPGRFPP